MEIPVSDVVALQYVGFESKGSVREYAFTLRGTDGASSEYFVTIANDAFVAHRVRYQDAPDICSLRIRREFATRTDHPPSTRFSVTTRNWPTISTHAHRRRSLAPPSLGQTTSTDVA